MKHITGLVVLLALFAANSASAKDTSNRKVTYKPVNTENTLYVGLSGNLTWPRNSSARGGNTGDVQYELSGGGNVALGYRANENIRVELEGGYHWLNIDKITLNNTIIDTSESMKIATIMANVYYDFPVANNYNLKPYVGVGLGDAFLNFPKTAGLGNVDNTDNEFAYQAMAGVSYTPASTPMMDWSIGYRYLGVYKPQFENVKFESLNTNNFEIGIRQHF